MTEPRTAPRWAGAEVRDLLAGLTVAAYLVPQVMGYAAVAGLPVVAGLWGLVAALTVYLLLGSSPQLSVGPESTTALMTAVIVAPLAAGDPRRYAALAAAVALIVAGICLLAWVARLGFLADLFSRPVLVGYMAGIAALMIIGQLDKATGVTIDGASIIDQLRSFFANIDELHVPTATIAVAVIAVQFAARRWFPRGPVALIAVVLSAIVVGAFSLDRYDISVVGEIPAGLPFPRIGDVSFDELRSLLLPAVGLSVVAFSDNVLTARVFANRHDYEVSANRELAALGAANAASGVVAGFPVSSSGSRTAIADAMGSTKRACSVVAVLVVVIVALAGRSLLATFPDAALAGVVVFAATQLVDVPQFRRLATFRRSEAFLAVATTIAVLVTDVLFGVFVAVALSIIDLGRRVARPHDGVLGYVPGVAGMHDIDDYRDARRVPGLIVYRYDSPLFFANAENFRRRALDALDHAEGGVEWFVLNAEANTELDSTALQALETLYEQLDEQGIVFAMARVKQQLRGALADGGFLRRVGEDRVFPTLPSAVWAYAGWYETTHGVPLPGIENLPVAAPVLPEE